MSQVFRKGGLGALMDEYERAMSEFIQILAGLDDAQFTLVRDSQTQDEHCRSIQTIASHVVASGYGYANYIRKALSITLQEFPYALLSRGECLDGLRRMLAYTAETLEGRWDYGDEQTMAVQIQSRWGPRYDMEQLLEHAIVHVLRHRRQVNRFLAAQK